MEYAGRVARRFAADARVTFHERDAPAARSEPVDERTTGQTCSNDDRMALARRVRQWRLVTAYAPTRRESADQHRALARETVRFLAFETGFG
jgi:hypothetical protein